MPNYEYRCADCGKRASIFQTYEAYGKETVQCPYCNSEKLERLINRVRVLRSEESRMDALSDPTAWGGFDEDDPKSMARMMRKMGNELGEEMPAEFDEVVDRLESGESPEDIEKTMPDLGVEGDFDF
jgi:putative FmdB family regulatory protein